jgi:hypothetical protein
MPLYRVVTQFVGFSSYLSHVVGRPVPPRGTAFYFLATALA